MRFIIPFSFLLLACNAQPGSSQEARRVGGPCDACEDLLQYGSKQLKAVDTLPGFADNEPKLKVHGTVFHPDGRPAEGVIIYIYHTNRKGKYPRGTGTDKTSRHGLHRGWALSDENGQYAFYTFRPGAYPGGSDPEHIHYLIKEPDLDIYWIDDVMFEDDPLLTPKARSRQQQRGGNGIQQAENTAGMLTVRRDIYLGKNIPNHPGNADGN